MGNSVRKGPRFEKLSRSRFLFTLLFINTLQAIFSIYPFSGTEKN